MRQTKILLTPGPCMTSDAVREAAGGPDLNHRDPEYMGLIRETKERLLAAYSHTEAGWHPYLLGGSGTLAVEAMITSCVKDGPVLILENGYYSSRIHEIFEIHGIPYRALTFGWLDAWDFDLIERELANVYEAVIGVHNETTTGRLNDISRLGKLCLNSGTKCLIDVMSSFGADDIDFTGLDAVCASGNKCLHGIPGVAFVLAKDTLSESISRIPRRSYYMSLPMYAGDNPPLTPPVPALSALRQALREFAVGGLVCRHDEYARRARFLREELLARGFQSAIPFEELSCTLSTFSLPKGFTFDRWFEANNEAGFVLYACKGELRNRFFQVSNMGELPQDDLASWIDEVDRIIVRAA